MPMGRVWRGIVTSTPWEAPARSKLSYTLGTSAGGIPLAGEHCSDWDCTYHTEGNAFGRRSLEHRIVGDV